MIDLKTLYEQTTMYCEFVESQQDGDYKTEIFHQPDTPIDVYVIWSNVTRTIISIVYTTLKGDTNNDSRN